MVDYDAALKKLLKVNSKRERISGIEHKGSCLSDELFTEYLENVLDPDKRDRVEEHLCACESCRKRSIILHSNRKVLTEKSLQKAPVNLTNKVKSLVTHPSRPSPIEVIIAVFKDTLGIVKNTASYMQPLQPAMALVRFSQKRAEASVANQYGQTKVVDTVSFNANFAELSVSITVEKSEGRQCQVDVKTVGAASGKPASNIRLTLLSKDRELSSQLTVNGYASFGLITTGKYTLEIKRKEEVLGSMILTLEDM